MSEEAVSRTQDFAKSCEVDVARRERVLFVVDGRRKIGRAVPEKACVADGEIVRRHPEVARARLVVDNPDKQDRMTLHVEVASNRSSSADAIVQSIRDVTKLRGEVAYAQTGSLPNDGKVIEDRRRYE